MCDLTGKLVCMTVYKPDCDFGIFITVIRDEIVLSLYSCEHDVPKNHIARYPYTFTNTHISFKIFESYACVHSPSTCSILTRT